MGGTTELGDELGRPQLGVTDVEDPRRCVSSITSITGAGVGVGTSVDLPAGLGAAVGAGALWLVAGWEEPEGSAAGAELSAAGAAAGSEGADGWVCAWACGCDAGSGSVTVSSEAPQATSKVRASPIKPNSAGFLNDLAAMKSSQDAG